MAEGREYLWARANRGETLTQAEVARLLGIRRQTVHAIERRALGKIRRGLSADTSDTNEDMAEKGSSRPPVRHPPRPPKGRYRQQYGVIVLCADEAEQRSVYERLKSEGLKIRVVVT
jgi:hypothetical protein